MIYKTFKDIKLSTLGMGNMRLPTVDDQPYGPIDYDRAQEIIDYAMANGINYYDTAYTYKGSEVFLGKAMAKYPRQSYYLATKYWIDANPDYRAVFEEQLKRLNTDYIDFYLVHSIMEGMGTVEQYINSGCIEYFQEEKRKGRIKYLGFSSHAMPENLAKMADYTDWDFAQIQVNYLDWACADTAKEYRILHERNIPIIVMEPIRGGRLANLPDPYVKKLESSIPGKSLTDLAFDFVRRLPGVYVTLSGMSSMDQIRENISLFSSQCTMTDAQAKTALDIAAQYCKSITLPCTRCGYCMDNCPKELAIPDYVELYNRLKYIGYITPDEIDDMPDEEKPHNCISCGKCTSHCPQYIDIPGLMKELSTWEGKNFEF